MSSPVPSDDPFAFDSDEEWDPYDDVPSQQRTQVNKLGFCQFADRDSNSTNDEHPPTLQYSIEWKVTVNNRSKLKETEQDVVLAPAVYWERFLQPNLENFLRKKDRPLRSEDTTVEVSVTKRGEDSITKQFDGTSIDWSIIENQLLRWGEFFREGKKLRLSLSFNYVDTTQSSSTSSRGGNNRGRLSTTQRMLADGAMQEAAEQGSSGLQSIWRDVYNRMRCPGAPCQKGPHCWIDPVVKKHYPLRAHHMRSLIRHAQEGHPLETYEDVPEAVREQLYVEEQQSIEKHKKTTNMLATSFPPINITNVLPTQSPLETYKLEP
jgi:hypothetical protein